MADPNAEPVALVTGGAGGIGAALCRRLATEGYRVVVADRDIDAAQELARTLDAGADRACAVEVDVTDLAANHAMVAHTRARYGRLDLLVLSAGTRPHQKPAHALDLGAYRRSMGIHVDGVVFGIDAGLPALAPGGAVLVLASMAGLAPEISNPLYAMTKSAVIGYVRSLARLFAALDRRINVLCPSITDTPFLGVYGRFLRRKGFPLLTPEQVADTAMTVLAGGGNGEAWELVAGWPARPHRFGDVQLTRDADGAEIQLRPIVSTRD